MTRLEKLELLLWHPLLPVSKIVRAVRIQDERLAVYLGIQPVVASRVHAAFPQGY